MLYGIIGNPVSHSMSPAIHNASFTERGLNNVYVPLKVSKIGDFIKEYRKIDFQGLLLFHIKRVFYRVLDDIEHTAKRIGAINTIVRQDGKLTGYNTDCMAAITVWNVAWGKMETH